MGCSSSKVDDLPAVTLCRERCGFLEEAIKQRYDFADSHVAYTQSLKAIGISLERFFNQDLHDSSSPLLSLPTQRKGGGGGGNSVATATATATAVVEPSSSQSPSAVTYHNHNHSNSGSHLHFHSEDEDSDDDDDDDESLHHSENLSPLHYNHDNNGTPSSGYTVNHDNNGTLSSGYTVNYMRNRTTPSVVYEQRPMSPHTVNYATAGPSSSNSAYYPYSYPNQENPPPPPPGSSYPPYYNNYPPAYSNYGYYGQPPYGSSPPQPPPVAAAASSSKPPPPPPSPPRASAWDFLNPFETFEKYYPPTTPSRDSKEVREEEGIPELEDENYQQEVVKEVHGEHKKFSVGGGDNYSKMVADEGERKKSVEALYQTRPSVSAEKEEKEYEVHLMEKNVVAKEQRSQDQGNVAAFKPRGGLRGVNDVVTEIRKQFERASESGKEILMILEAGKIPYHRKSTVHQVSSKMLHSITPSLSIVSSQPSTSKSAESSSSIEKIGSDYLDFEEDARMGSVNLSSTLQKLYIWEKKLYAEVKAEEKMRVDHERKSGRLKRLVERGAEAQKLESTRTLVRTLSTKIRIAIQIVDRMSIKINKLRDEELWPQIKELLGGLVRMWTAMLECHQNQCQAMAEAKNLDAFASNRKLSDANLEATLQLELELLNWILSFSRWITAQKGYIKALNGWLLKCILYEPEETSDGIRPFSPSSIGAPPIFVICNQWSQAMERISDKEVLDAMKVFATSVFQLWEQHNLEMRQRMMANKDMERQVKALEREEHKMQKAVQAMDKQLVLVSTRQSIGLPMPGHIVNQSGTTNSSLQSGLKMIFEAMERFTANSKQAFEDLRIRTEEVTRDENAKVS